MNLYIHNVFEKNNFHIIFDNIRPMLLLEDDLVIFNINLKNNYSINVVFNTNKDKKYKFDKEECIKAIEKLTTILN